MRKVGKRYEALSVGTTTSMRLDRFTASVLRDYDVRVILGKGGLSHESAQAMTKYGAVYLSVTGGAAASETLQLEAIETVYWEDLMLRFKGFGPLMVGIDAHGGNVQADVQNQARARLLEVNKRLGLD